MNDPPNAMQVDIEGHREKKESEQERHRKKAEEKNNKEEAPCKYSPLDMI